MVYKSKNSGLHLSQAEREIIFTGINNGSTKSAIAKTLGKDKSTIGKEIKLHRQICYKCRLPLECAAYKSCKYARLCKSSCPDYSPFKCKRRDRSPGACNGCENFKSCRFTKYKYSPFIAHSEYRDTLVHTRQGFDLTLDEAKKLGNILKPLIDQGQSVYSILASHPEIQLSERTLYTYIESGIFKNIGIDLGSLNLRRQVSRKMSKKKANTYKKREDRSFLKGRTFSEYEAFMKVNSDASVVQMDTVYNDVSNGPFVQTFKFTKYHIFLCLYHDTKTAEDMVKGVNLLEDLLGEDLFASNVEVLLTDRGSEFCNANDIEHRNGEERRRTRVFYCDPMSSWQKGTLENNHIDLRDILPKGCNLRNIGFTSQKAANIVSSNINSFPRRHLNGKSPMDYLQFMNPDLYNALVAFGIQHIDKDRVILKPYVLK